ncbi:MAG: hypothetical protein H6728_12565 [Myxococcales bacterium]|nr:hypothetical protein [Myxococcales bacterium]MCB9643900.1 hypothetical protein [Myxococcales bacterium]
MKLKLALWGIFLFSIGAMTTWRGIKDLVVSVREAKPTKMTCAEYYKRRPSVRWLHLTRCRIDYRRAGLFDYNGKIIRKSPSGMISPIFVVAVKPDVPKYSGMVQLLMRVEGNTKRQLLHTLFHFKAEKKEAELQRMLREQKKDLVVVQEIRGFASFGDDVTGTLHSKMRFNFPDNLARRYGLLNQGRRPPGGLGWILIGFGGVFLIAGLGLFMKSFQGKDKDKDAAEEVVSAILNG